MRGECRLGEMLAEQKKVGAMRGFGDRDRKGSKEEPLPPKLSDLGIDKKLSMRAQTWGNAG